MKSSGFVRLKSAVVNGGSAGRRAVFRKILAPATRSLDRMFSLGQKQVIDEFPKCALLCCPPRTGSTFMYQLVTHVVPCAYVANVHQLAPRLGSRVFPHKPMRNGKISGLTSFYGHTSDLWDVNEGNELVDYWFRDVHVENIRLRFKETLLWLGASADVPAILKNVAVYDRLAKLHEAVPEVLYVRIRRNPQQSIESSLRAFRDLGYINPVPENLDTKDCDDVEMIAEQVRMIEDRISKELSRVPQDSVMEWGYEAFCENPRELVDELCTRLGVAPNWNENIFPLAQSKRKKVSDEDSRRIAELLGR